jgi:hypothetical protein
MSNALNQSPYLRTSRNFPENDAHQLAVEINRSYVDIAEKVNKRTIGLYPTNKPVINGEGWFLSKNQRQQALRQAYPFTTKTPIPHGIIFGEIERFVTCWGEYTDDTNWYGLIHGSSVAIAGQVSFYLTPTNITFLTGAGAPALTKGTIVLTWLSEP